MSCFERKPNKAITKARYSQCEMTQRLKAIDKISSAYISFSNNISTPGESEPNLTVYHNSKSWWKLASVRHALSQCILVLWSYHFILKVFTSVIRPLASPQNNYYPCHPSNLSYLLLTLSKFSKKKYSLLPLDTCCSLASNQLAVSVKKSRESNFEEISMDFGRRALVLVLY